VAVITYFTRGYLVNFINPGGDPLMAGLLGALTVAILFRSIYYIAARSFYAQQDTKTPFYISIFSIGLNIFLAVWFTVRLQMGPYGLAWAQSIMAMVEVIILFAVMNARIDKLFDRMFWNAIWRMASATGFMAIVAYLMVSLFPLQAGDNSSFYFTFPKFVLIVATSFGSYIIFSKMLRLHEVAPFEKIVQRISRRSRPDNEKLV